MVTKTYCHKDGTPYAMYHRAGTIDGRKDEKWVWTHPYKKTGDTPQLVGRAECEACINETIPAWVKSSPA